MTTAWANGVTSVGEASACLGDSDAGVGTSNSLSMNVDEGKSGSVSTAWAEGVTSVVGARVYNFNQQIP